MGRNVGVIISVIVIHLIAPVAVINDGSSPRFVASVMVGTIRGLSLRSCITLRRESILFDLPSLITLGLAFRSFITLRTHEAI